MEDLDAEQFDKFARAACEEFGKGEITDERWAPFSALLSFVAVGRRRGRRGPGPRRRVRAGRGRGRAPSPLPAASHPGPRSTSCTSSSRPGLVERSRIIMEKPFGTDFESAVALNAEVHEVFREEQVFRIDHFLGKEAAQNILAFRFANGLEPIWNRNFIDHVQIDVPEMLGLEGRTKFYEGTGAYRDMVVTHLMQVLAFMPMEPPTTLTPEPISDEKLKVFRSMRPIEPHNVVRGQYTGYRGNKSLAELGDLGARHGHAIALLGILLEEVLVVFLGRPVVGQRQHLGHDRFAEQLVLAHLADHPFRLLLSVRARCSRSCCDTACRCRCPAGSRSSGRG